MPPSAMTPCPCTSNTSERFGLLVILVLGEAVGGAARGVHDAHWAAESIAVGVAGFTVAARPEPTGPRRAKA